VLKKEKIELTPKTHYSYLYIYNCLETINIRFCKLYPVATLNSLLFFNIPQSSIEKSLTASVILVTNLLFKIPSPSLSTVLVSLPSRYTFFLRQTTSNISRILRHFQKEKKKRNFLLIQMVVRMVRVVGVLVLALVSFLLDSVGP
jgi:hypothetical protein